MMIAVDDAFGNVGVLQYVAVCCSALQCVAVLFTVLQCAAVCYIVSQCVVVCVAACGKNLHLCPLEQPLCHAMDSTLNSTEV